MLISSTIGKNRQTAVKLDWKLVEVASVLAACTTQLVAQRRQEAVVKKKKKKTKKKKKKKKGEGEKGMCC